MFGRAPRKVAGQMAQVRMDLLSECYQLYTWRCMFELVILMTWSTRSVPVWDRRILRAWGP